MRTHSVIPATLATCDRSGSHLKFGTVGHGATGQIYLGTRLRKARTIKKLSQEAVALAVDMDRSYISGLERGEFNVSVLKLAKIAKVLGVRLEHLFHGE